ncbi:MAG TPA: hypothetical protein PLE74_07530 [Candidatus Cloacimonadota bacterium]|nr:hypothetical protein [Candidatus Cloacimonadota bacterium]
MKTTLNGMSRYLLASGILTAIKDVKAQADKAALDEVHLAFNEGNDCYDRCRAYQRYSETFSNGLDEYIPWALDYCAHNAIELSVQYEDGMISKEQFLHDLASWLFERADD